MDVSAFYVFLEDHTMKQTITTVAILAVLATVSCTALAQPPGGQSGPGRFNPLIRLFDADGDGTLSEIEMAGAAAKLKEFDKNKDGKVNDEELIGALPFGRGPGAGRPQFGPGGPGRGPGSASTSDLQKEPVAQDDTEKKILSALAQMQQGERYRNVSNDDGRLLRLLAEAVDAKCIVEIGTSTGESATWLALALQSTGGHLFTHELDPGRAEVAKENFKKAGVEDLITVVMGDAHETVKGYTDPDSPRFIDTEKRQCIDLLFLDADKEGYIDYLDKLMPLLRPGGLIVAHNMNTRQADARYVKAITENPQLETMILLKEGTGVSVTLKKK
jgi:predicted O-methyltransferase YrrM